MTLTTDGESIEGKLRHSCIYFVQKTVTQKNLLIFVRKNICRKSLLIFVIDIHSHNQFVRLSKVSLRFQIFSRL